MPKGANARVLRGHASPPTRPAEDTALATGYAQADGDPHERGGVAPIGL